MASIVVTTGEQKGNYYPLGQRTTVLGRDEGLLVQILDGKVSRKHMQIRYDRSQDKYYAVDMNSKHSVFINDRQVNEEAELKDNDYIRIGETVILFLLQDFKDKESALNYYKRVGERRKDTYESTNERIY